MPLPAPVTTAIFGLESMKCSPFRSTALYALKNLHDSYLLWLGSSAVGNEPHCKKKAGSGRPFLLNLPFADSRIAAQRRNFLHQFGDKPLKHVLVDLHALANDRALAEHRFAGFVCGLLALIEEADRNAVAPFMRTLSGHGNICRIVSLFVLEPVTALLEILVGIHLVIGDAWAEGVNQREALVLNARGDQIGHVIGFT